MMMRILSSKKAGVELTSENIVGLILAALAILGLVGLTIALFSIFSGAAHGGSRTTLTGVFDGVNALYDSRINEEGCYIAASDAFIEANWAIVGFNADGVSSANNAFSCEMGENCVQETCGWDDAIIKPRSCGRGPCVCLCDGGRGDVTGEDCQASTAICRRFPSRMGFDRWYKPQVDDPCSTTVAGITGSVCDLVLYGETCGGTVRDVQYSLVIRKVGEDALVLDQVPAGELRTRYPTIGSTCEELKQRINALDRSVEIAEGKAPADNTPSGPTTEETIEANKKGRLIVPD